MKRFMNCLQFRSSVPSIRQLFAFKRFSEEQKKPKVQAAPTSAYASMDKLQPSHYALKGKLIVALWFSGRNYEESKRKVYT